MGRTCCCAVWVCVKGRERVRELGGGKTEADCSCWVALRMLWVGCLELYFDDDDADGNDDEDGGWWM